MSDNVWVGTPGPGLWLVGDSGAVASINAVFCNTPEPIYYTVDIWGCDESFADMKFDTLTEAKWFVESTCELRS